VRYRGKQRTANPLGLGFNFDKPMIGIEYLTRVVLRAPNGETYEGSAHFEHYINGAYVPYGFE